MAECEFALRPKSKGIGRCRLAVRRLPSGLRLLLSLRGKFLGQGLLPAEHPYVYHLPMAKEHRLGDIIATSVTHGVGAALALAGAVVLVVTTVGGTAWLFSETIQIGRASCRERV